MRNTGPAELRGLWKDLDKVRRETIAEWVEERFQSDTAFQIMHRYIDEKLAQIEKRPDRAGPG